MNPLSKPINFLKRQCVQIGLILFVIGLNDSTAQVSEDTTKILVTIGRELHYCSDTPTPIHADTIVGGQPPYHCLWMISEGVMISTDTLIWEGSDTTEIQLKVIDALGRTAIENVSLYPYEIIDATFTAEVTSGCSPFMAVFSSNYQAYQHVESMTWTFDDGNTDTSMASVIHTYTPAGEYYPTLTITDNHGCRYLDTLQVPVRVFPSPTAHFKLVDDQLYLPETTVHTINESAGADSFLWRFAQWGQSTDESPRFDFPSNTEGEYVITLKASNAFGCWDEVNHEMRITQGINLFIPNAFTPDGDGLNDTWGIQGPGADTFRFSVEVYDAWGVVVFASNELDALWTGENVQTQEKAHPGMYNFRVLARDTERGIGHLFEGHVQLLR